jgi:hypothetical protein
LIVLYHSRPRDLRRVKDADRDRGAARRGFCSPLKSDHPCDDEAVIFELDNPSL